MYEPPIKLLRIALPLLIAVAIVGYVVGHQHTPGKAAPIAYGRTVLLEHPIGWRAMPATAAPAIPGLAIGNELLLAPGTGAFAGLLSGQIVAQPSQLPSSFLTRLHGLPQTQVVGLFSTEAYRYSQLNLPGFLHALALYVVPTAGSTHTVLACYAESVNSGYMQQCQQIVAKLAMVGNGLNDLAPEASYADPLIQLIGDLNLTRATLRRRMRASSAAATIAQLATTLASGYQAAAASMGTLEAPPPASPTQAALRSSIIGSQHAYDALAAAALAHDPSRYRSARSQVDAAESSVNTALQSFTLLGYGTT